MNIDLNFLVGQFLESLLENLYILTTLTDDHTGTVGADGYGDHLERTFDDDARNACFSKLGAEEFTDFRVLEKGLAVLLAAIPVGIPSTDDTETVSDRIYFLSHLD